MSRRKNDWRIINQRRRTGLWIKTMNKEKRDHHPVSRFQFMIYKKSWSVGSGERQSEVCNTAPSPSLFINIPHVTFPLQTPLSVSPHPSPFISSSPGENSCAELPLQRISCPSGSMAYRSNCHALYTTPSNLDGCRCKCWDLQLREMC